MWERDRSEVMVLCGKASVGRIVNPNDPDFARHYCRRHWREQAPSAPLFGLLAVPTAREGAS